jgi:hypothetical protein
MRIQLPYVFADCFFGIAADKNGVFEEISAILATAISGHKEIA